MSSSAIENAFFAEPVGATCASKRREDGILDGRAGRRLSSDADYLIGHRLGTGLRDRDMERKARMGLVIDTATTGYDVTYLADATSSAVGPIRLASTTLQEAVDEAQADPRTIPFGVTSMVIRRNGAKVLTVGYGDDPYRT